MVANGLGTWSPLSPAEVARLFAGVKVLWWIAGGWAIDLFVGRQTRSHDDIDVQILREDQITIQRHLSEWDLHAADPPGTLRPWLPGEVVPPDVHDVWCRREPASPWVLQLMLADTAADRWVFRRDPRVTRPLVTLTRWTSEGLPYLAPEVQLLFKARAAPRAKDEHDFDIALPLLDTESRGWLAEALSTCNPKHPWLGRL